MVTLNKELWMLLFTLLHLILLSVPQVNTGGMEPPPAYNYVSLKYIYSLVSVFPNINYKYLKHKHLSVHRFLLVTMIHLIILKL